LDGRKRNYRLKAVSNESLPLRGFLLCPKCNKLLTGSASRGHTKYYSYYHCTDGCSCRYGADNVNQQFVYEIKKYIPKSEIVDLFKELIAEELNDQTNNIQDESKQLGLQIKELQEKIAYIRELLSSKQIEPADFREMKSEYSTKLERLEAKLSASNDDQVDIKGLLDKGVNNLLRLEYLYETADTEKKWDIISSMYPEKLTFDGFTLRTTRLNEVIRVIYSVGKGFGENKNRTNGSKTNLSCNVGLLGFEPRRTESKSVVLPLHYNPIISQFSLGVQM
jgi:site-specific DNA recombinase